MICCSELLSSTQLQCDGPKISITIWLQVQQSNNTQVVNEQLLWVGMWQRQLFSSLSFYLWMTQFVHSMALKLFSWLSLQLSFVLHQVYLTEWNTWFMNHVMWSPCMYKVQDRHTRIQGSCPVCGCIQATNALCLMWEKDIFSSRTLISELLGWKLLSRRRISPASRFKLKLRVNPELHQTKLSQQRQKSPFVGADCLHTECCWCVLCVFNPASCKFIMSRVVWHLLS